MYIKCEGRQPWNARYSYIHTFTYTHTIYIYMYICMYMQAFQLLVF